MLFTNAEKCITQLILFSECNTIVSLRSAFILTLTRITIGGFMCGGDAALCQITLTVCYVYRCMPVR